jgi:hypothetical protein
MPAQGCQGTGHSPANWQLHGWRTVHLLGPASCRPEGGGPVARVHGQGASHGHCGPAGKLAKLASKSICPLVPDERVGSCAQVLGARWLQVPRQSPMPGLLFPLSCTPCVCGDTEMVPKNVRDKRQGGIAQGVPGEHPESRTTKPQGAERAKPTARSTGPESWL